MLAAGCSPNTSVTTSSTQQGLGSNGAFCRRLQAFGGTNSMEVLCSCTRPGTDGGDGGFAALEDLERSTPPGTVRPELDYEGPCTSNEYWDCWVACNQ
jgi:hypothetical protein